MKFLDQNISGAALDRYRSRFSLLFRGVSIVLKDCRSDFLREKITRAIELIHATLTASEVCELATPSVHSSLSKFHRDYVLGVGDNMSARLGLLLALIDAYVSSLKMEFAFDIPQGNSDPIYLHTLGVTLPATTPRICVQLKDGTPHMNGLEMNPVILELSGKGGRLYRATFSAFGDSSVFASVPYSEIDIKCDSKMFCSTVLAAHRFISAHCSTLADNVASRIQLYVPLYAPSKFVHRSFSSPGLPGAIFLSHSPDTWMLAEAIVHEFSHNQLNALSGFESLSTDDKNDYYSPWRHDRRPLNGLLHALYVFCEVWLFLHTVRKTAKRPLSAHLIERQRLIAHRLVLGLRQADRSRLTPLGRSVLEIVKDRISQLSMDLKQETEPPELVKTHLATFIQENPNVIIRR